jgi:hypothetical protein
VNDLNETIGTIDDVIVTKDHEIYMPVCAVSGNERRKQSFVGAQRPASPKDPA